MTGRKPRRPSPRWSEHAASAVTPEDHLAASYDRLRATLAHLRRKRRDQLERAADMARADQLAEYAARFLMNLCENGHGA
jgi:hypothetical protein